MRITFQCPGCNTNLEIEADTAGTQLECPSCKTSVTVPRPVIGPGVTIGGFKIVKLLGTGGMGEVYLARQLSMDRDIALKILPGYLTLHKEPVQRFLQEVRLLARLDHPHIVTAHEAGKDGGVFYMAMAYVDGDPLNTKLDRDGPMPEQQTLSLGLKIAHALAYAWSEHRLIHRDIKPGNIMLDKHGEPRLMDLGLSKSLAGPALTMSERVLGTPNYMSPEQAEGREVDYRSDMYSLGATLYHMLTGQLPFAGSSILEVLRKQATESLPDPRSIRPGITDSCAALLEIMLAKDPAKRHGDWAGLVADIDRVLAGNPPMREPLKPGESVLVKFQARVSAPGDDRKRIVLTHAEAEQLQKRGRPGARKPLSLAVGAMALLVVLLAAGGALYLFGRRARPMPAREPKALAESAAASATEAAAAQVEADRVRIETLAKLYAEAEKYSGEYPDEYAEIQRRFERIAREGAGTEFEEKAAASLRRLESEGQRAADEAMARIEAQAEHLCAEGRTEEAIASLRGYAGPLAEKTKARRQALADRLAQRAGEARQAAAKEAESARAALDGLVKEVADALFRGDIAAAEAAVAGAGRDRVAGLPTNEWADVRKTVAAAASLPKTILASFRGEVGREVNIVFKTGAQTLKIVSVGPAEVRARRQISTAGFAERNFTVDELSLQEKFKRLGGPTRLNWGSCAGSCWSRPASRRRP